MMYDSMNHMSSLHSTPSPWDLSQGHNICAAMITGEELKYDCNRSICLFFVFSL